jgi:formamidopyrimidine-DNA glycosylase
MPELPDVELFRRHLDAHALDQTIQRVSVNDARILAEVTPQRLAARLKGARFVSSRRHGKHLLVRLSEGGWLTLHFGLTGRLHYFHDMADEPSYDRVRFDFSNGRHLAYVNLRLLGRVGLTEDADAFIEAEGLGPDALDPGFDLEAFMAALGRRRGSVKSLLMDQGLVAGIGNIYSDEILFQARLHPNARAEGLEPGALKRLFRNIKQVLETAIARDAGSEQFLDRLPRGYLLRAREKGGRCPRCAREIAVLKVSGRTGYFCPRCQSEGTPRPPRGAAVTGRGRSG